jgi:type I restriction enzyme S subunit
MSEEKLVPKLRFDGFNKVWESKQIGEIAEVVGGGTPKTEIVDYWDGEIKWFTPSEIGKTKYVFDSDRHITEKGLKNSSAKLLPKDALLLSSRATVGEISIALTECSTNQGFQSLITKSNVDNDFIYYLISTIKNEFLRRSSGSTFLEINKNEIKRMPINIPELSEQKKISNLFSAIDNKIEMLEKKCEYYQDFKKYLMQRIFSSSDDKLRFDFDEIRLKSISKINKGKQLNKEHMLEIGKFYVLNGGQEPSGYTDSWNTSENTITISEGGNSCGFVNFNTEKFWSGGHCYYLNKLSENIDVYYLYSYLKFIEPQIMRLRVGSGLPNIQKGDIENIKIKILPKKEQIKISNLLLSTDNKISSIESQKDSFEIFKKGLLQQMFV